MSAVEESAAAPGGAGVARGHMEPVSAARGGAQLVVAGVISLLANYLFLLGSGRLLGAADYGTLAALTGLLTVVLLPIGAVQMAASREISRHEALGERAEAAAFSRALLVLGSKLAIPILIVAAALVIPLRELLRIDDTAPVALALTILAGIFVYPIVLGVMQGEQRFRALAFNSAAPMVVRLVVFVALAAAGMRLYGALGAIALSAALAVALGVLTIRGTLGLGRSLPSPALRPFLRYLVPVAVGLFGIAVLTNADILVVKARFSSEDAGVYAAASAFARVAFFLPATILAVLFPRTAARQARGEQSADILGRSVIVTIGFCALLAAGYSLVGQDIVDVTFGSDFSAAAGLLVPFCLVMTCYSVANVLLAYHLSRGERRYAWVVAGSVVVQLGVLATLPGSLREMLWANLAVGVALLVAHELTMGSSAAALGAGYRRFGVGAALRRVIAAVIGVRGRLLEGLVVVSGYWLLAVVATWPLVLGLGDTLPGPFPSDGAGTTAWLWEMRQEDGYRLLGTTHHTLTGAPLGWDQGNALNFQWLLPYYPAYLLAGLVGEVAALNLIALAGLALSGAAMYLLVRYLGCGRFVSAWAGLVYLMFPWHLERVMAGHQSLVHLEVFPLLVLAAIAWVRRPTDGRAALVALAVVAAWLTSGYFGATALITLIGVTAVGVMVNRRPLGWATSVGRAAKLWAMGLIGAASVALTSFVVGGAAGISIGRDSSELELYGGHLVDYLPDPATPVLGGLTDGLGSQTIPYYSGVENRLYPGMLTVAFALVWLVVAWRGRSRLSEKVRVGTLTAGAVTLAAVVFSMPSPMQLGPLSIHPMPSYLMIQVLPSFRVPSRLIIVAMVGLLVLAALGLSWLTAWVRAQVGSTRAGGLSMAAMVAAACLVSVAELNVLPLKTSTPGDTPAEYQAVGRTPRGIVAEYPLTPAGDPPSSSAYVFWQRAHGRPLLNGAGLYTNADAVRRMLVDPGAFGTAESLALLGVTSIVTRPTALDWVKGTGQSSLPSYDDGYRLVGGSASGTQVFQVTAAPAPALIVYRGADSAEPLRPDASGFVGYPVTGPIVHVDVYARRAGLWRIRFDGRVADGRATLRVEGSDAVTTLGTGPVEVAVVIPRGRSTLTLSLEHLGASPGAQWADIALSRPLLLPPKPGDNARALAPVRVSSTPGF